VNKTTFEGSWATPGATDRRGARGAVGLGTDLAHFVFYSSASNVSFTLHPMIEKGLDCLRDVYYNGNVRPRGPLTMPPRADAALTLRCSRSFSPRIL
jgi:hypothetical protein